MNEDAARAAAAAAGDHAFLSEFLPAMQRHRASRENARAGISLEPSAPEHLTADSKRARDEMIRLYTPDRGDQIVLLTLCEALDRRAQAREQIARDGVYIKDRFGVTQSHPGLATVFAVTTAIIRRIIHTDLLVHLDLECSIGLLAMPERMACQPPPDFYR